MKKKNFNMFTGGSGPGSSSSSIHYWFSRVIKNNLTTDDITRLAATKNDYFSLQVKIKWVHNHSKTFGCYNISFAVLLEHVQPSSCCELTLFLDCCTSDCWIHKQHVGIEVLGLSNWHGEIQFKKIYRRHSNFVGLFIDEIKLVC